MKNTVISTEAQVLLKLLRLALGTEPRRYFGEPVEPFPNKIDWKVVIRLSYQHKVSALAVDGLKSSEFDLYNGLDERQANELKPIVDNWFNDVVKTEQSYTYYHQVLNTLCQIYKANGLTPIILKGYGLSLNYPIPSHRSAGDIDIYLIDKKGILASSEGDRIANDILRLKVERQEGSKHSHFDFKGITVENHYELRSLIYGDEAERDFIDTLHKTIVKNYTKCGDSDYIYMPSPDFNALYLIRHMFSDFHCRKPILRQFCDYYFFLSHWSDSVDWTKVNDILKRAGLAEFAANVTNILNNHFNSNVNNPFRDSINKNIEQLLLDELFGNYYHEKSGIANLGFYLKNKSFYSYFYRRHWLPLTIARCKQYLTNKTHKYGI